MYARTTPPWLPAPALLLLFAVALGGCRNGSEAGCREAYRERELAQAAIARNMQAARAAGRKVQLPLSEALGALTDEPTFLARCQDLRPEAVRCVSNAYNDGHAAECAPHRDQVNRVHLR